MTTPITTSTIDSQMHNKIMAVGSRDRPPMLVTRRYAQWQSRFLRYINTRPNDDALRKCILEGPYQPTTIIIPVIHATADSLAVPERTTVEKILTMSPENKAHYESEKEAIHLLFPGIRDEIYSTVDACKTGHEMWIAIERLQQGESLNIQDVKTNLFWEFGKFTSHDGESMESYYSRFYKMMNEMIRNNLTVATMQYQKEVNEIRAERIAKNANPLALVVAALPYPDPYNQAPKSHKPYAPTSKRSSSTRSNASTKFKGKEIAKPITPPSESACKEDSDPKHAQRDKDINKNMDTSLSQVVQQTGIQCFNCKEFGHFAKERKKPIKVKDLTYHKEKMLLCKQAEKGVPLQEVPTADSGTDTELLEQVLNDSEYNVFANVRQHSESFESTSNTCLVEKDDSNVTPDSLDMYDNDIQTHQNVEDERVVLANLIANLKLDVDENKKIQKQLKKVNASLAHELKECKSILTETSRTLEESNSIRDSYLIALQNKQIEFERELVDQAWEQHSHNHFCTTTALDMEVLIKTCLMPLAIKTQNDSFVFVHELKQEMHVDLKYAKSLEKEINKLESDKAEFSNMYDILLQECVSNDVMCSYLHSLSDLEAHSELHDLKAQLQDKNIAISELKKLIEKCKGKSVETKFVKPSVVRQLNAQRIPKPSVLGKLTPFSDSLERNSFSKTKLVSKTNMSEGLSKPVATRILPQTTKQVVRNTNMIKPGMYRIYIRTTQARAPQLPQTSRNTNPRVSTSTGVIHRTNVSRPQLRSTQMKDKVRPTTIASEIED
ncbi:hypothetical protein Tco_1091403 [Tanacetum coccineum]|uniref:Integrase, catalytic region, zinc finger, CCHC-type, peptidase aspartic, catalytic n=1 Tax=Tanacetum coccineum TaxID=301880 RepID=A0ABQ5I6Y7_9ASTR